MKNKACIELFRSKDYTVNIIWFASLLNKCCPVSLHFLAPCCLPPFFRCLVDDARSCMNELHLPLEVCTL